MDEPPKPLPLAETKPTIPGRGRRSKAKDPNSEHFNAADADITFQSVDGVQFRLHRKNLGCAAAAFPGAEFESNNDEIVPVPERSEVLDLLFRFMYPERQPNLRKVTFRVLADLADTAEKYEVYSAMATCHTHMTAEIEKHPLEVLIYGAKHDYPDLLDKAATLVIGQPLDNVIDRMPPAVAIAWVGTFHCSTSFMPDLHQIRSDTTKNGEIHTRKSPRGHQTVTAVRGTITA
ncbi:hypothetical protein AX15_000552 [Amanita polypyramis BW_CC]|nr:hypothetical protein AX15_000552 [Amanita polypyramis BW_CC]